MGTSLANKQDQLIRTCLLARARGLLVYVVGQEGVVTSGTFQGYQTILSRLNFQSTEVVSQMTSLVGSAIFTTDFTPIKLIDYIPDWHTET